MTRIKGSMRSASSTSNRRMPWPSALDTLQPLDLPAGAEDLHAVEVQAALFALAQQPMLVPLVIFREMLAHDRVDADLVAGAPIERDLDAGKPPSDCARDP